MLEQPDDQQTAKPEETPATEASPQATGKLSEAGTITEEQVKAYLAANPGALDGVTRKLKVNGEDVEVPLSELVGHAQKGLAATQTWEEAKRLREEAEKMKADYAAPEDPVKRLAEALVAHNKPATPPDALESITSPNALFENPELAITAMQQHAKELAELRERLDKLGQQSEKQTAEVARRNAEALAQYEQRVGLRHAFEELHQADPSFTASITGTNDDGSPIIDYGDNPYVTMATLGLMYSDKPDARLKGRAGRSMAPLEVHRMVKADNAAKVKADEQRELAARERERRQSVGGVGMPASTGPAFEIPPDLRPNPADTPEVRDKKIREIEGLIHKRARDGGVKYEIELDA